jgi:flagellar hook assembly protein FlgD
LRIQNVLSGIEFDSGEFKIYLKVKDQAGNINNEEIAYTIQTNMSDIVSNFINYPNPFSPLTGGTTSFRYSIVDQDIVSTQSGNLMIYDLSGNLIYLRKLYPEELTLGTHEVIWDGKTNSGIILADGVYFGMIDFDNYKTRIHKIAIINEK